MSSEPFIGQLLVGLGPYMVLGPESKTLIDCLRKTFSTDLPDTGVELLPTYDGPDPFEIRATEDNKN